MSAVAIIPTRDDSKCLPCKNVINFLGKPVIAYTIEAAIESRCFERVVVSTGDDEIAVTAERWGALVDRGASALMTDNATILDVCFDFLDREAAVGRHWKTMACLLATAPMRAAEDIRRTMALLEPRQCGFAVAVTQYDLPPHQALKLAADGGLSPMWPDLVDRRASDLPQLRASNGSTYVVDVAEFRRSRTFYGPGMRGYDMPPGRSIDIDTRTDLDLALMVARSSSFES